MQKILVTGATGFIGHYVVTALLEKGFAVTATSRDKEKAATQSWFSKVNYIPFDLKDFDNSKDYFRHFNEPDKLIHLAWEGLPNYKETFHVQENLPRHFNFLKNLLEHGLKDITVTGTCFEYGMKEGCLSEDMECEPANPYAIAKNELRCKLQQLEGRLHFNLKWIRLFYMFGRGQSPKSLISQLDKALEANEPVFNMSEGEQVRDFLPVEKVAEYIVAVAGQQSVTGIINCCSGKPVTVKEFVLEYLKEKNKSISLNFGYYPYADYEPMRFWGDERKLKTVLGRS
ncbi:MAG: NAD(P)-dependent oxidoreductase [Ferruginibacter sp.]